MILDQYKRMLRCTLRTDGGFSAWSGGWDYNSIVRTEEMCDYF